MLDFLDDVVGDRSASRNVAEKFGNVLNALGTAVGEEENGRVGRGDDGEPV